MVKLQLIRKEVGEPKIKKKTEICSHIFQADLDDCKSFYTMYRITFAVALVYCHHVVCFNFSS